MKRFKTQLSVKEHLKSINKTPHTTVMHWYRDGFGYERQHALGIYEPVDNLKNSMRRGELAMAFQVELLAIKDCRDLLVKRSTKNKQIYGWSNSQVVIKTVLQSSAVSKLIWETTQVLENLGKSNEVHLSWFPGYIV